MDEHEKWRELLPWYVNGTLDERSQVALEAHLRDCPACRRELAVWRRISTAVAAQPSPRLPQDAPSRLAALARPRPWNDLRLIPLLLRSQLPVIRGEIWPASALVLALGTLVALATGSQTSGALAFALIAPVVAAMGIAFLYGPAVDPALEVELAAPTPPQLVLVARVLLVFGFDLGLGLGGSLLLALLRPEISLWPLVSAWLAPMVFLSALSLLLSVHSADPTAGALISLGLWGVQVARQMGAFEGASLPVPDLASAAARPWLLALALLMGGLAVWMSGREERWLRGRA